MKAQRFTIVCLFLVTLALGFAPAGAQNSTALTQHSYIPFISGTQSEPGSPPASPVKLIFIHHSTGENWLTDGYGNLGHELAANNYFVSDTNYGWGPNGIGDRTDILNWREWFRGPDSPTYLQALFNENGQHASYRRTFNDPGGENQIILFKSCFPNSALAGQPDDLPDPNEALTVGHAKYVYNDLLNYFITRPDKLFIVITAPPLQDPTYAANARAFNNWLVFDWLVENNYPYKNVAVFDFYNVLTHPDNHHRVANGEVEHIIDRETNTLYYDSDGDDHPNPAGSQKATQEFVPWLNFYYQRWIASEPAAPFDPASEPPAADATSPANETDAPLEDQLPALLPSAPGGWIDDFETSLPAGTQGWQAFWDQATGTQIRCSFTGDQASDGAQSLRIDFEIAPDSWGTCTLLFDAPQDWSQARGLAFNYQASAPGLSFEVTVHGGRPAELTSYQFSPVTVSASTTGWVPLEVTWDQILGVGWEAPAGNPVDPTQVTGVAFSFGSLTTTPNAGSLWVDSLRLLDAEPSFDDPLQRPEEPGSGVPSVQEDAQVPDALHSEASPEDPNGGFCPGSALLGVVALVGFFTRTGRRLFPLVS
ncbi:MAG: hypothetical protein JW862_19815 [Anaerolineales bacterium]|nr:hypothetical protein [Anaerolineales bacterium]